MTALGGDPFEPTDRRAFPAPLTIGVIADTHVRAWGVRRLPPEVPDLFARFGVGLILHAGDVNTAGHEGGDGRSTVRSRGEV